jgi:hypothetical protein
VYPEFCTTPPRPEPLAAAVAAPVGRAAAGLRALRQWQVLLSTGFGLGLLAAAALCRFLLTL